MTEIWKDIPDWEGKYQVSNLARVRSLDRWVEYKNGYRRFWPGRVLSPVQLDAGYLKVTLYGPRAEKTIHSLVAHAFIPNPNNYPIVRHWDDDPLNNSLNNLVWGTYSDNEYDKVRNGNNWESNKIEGECGHLLTIELNQTNNAAKRNQRACRACKLSFDWVHRRPELKPYRLEIADIMYERVLENDIAGTRLKPIKYEFLLDLLTVL